ncbi:hypothetical protein [Pseudomonas sp. nanlin1]|uniref:hypothetical protein n=1 Tax=Pseudomonas sp. nanlin1 TaxID=3040605 RepID=UPI00389114C4
MNKYNPIHFPLRRLGPSRRTSCLTINQPGAKLALMNLLDVVSHEITDNQDHQTHRLTFKSGEVLMIDAKECWINVRGAYVSFHSDDHYPLSTFIGDPME